MDIFCGVASISHLLLISIERYICISSPLTYHTIVTIRKTRIAISTTWFFALTMTVIKLFLSGSVRVVRVYQFVAFSLCFATPVLGMSFAYIMIFRVSRTQAKKLTLRIGEKTKKFCLPKELKAAKTLGVVIGGFLLCWFPFFLLNMSYALCRWVENFKFRFNLDLTVFALVTGVIIACVLLWIGLILFPSLCSFCFMPFASPCTFLHKVRAGRKY